MTLHLHHVENDASPDWPAIVRGLLDLIADPVRSTGDEATYRMASGDFNRATAAARKALRETPHA